MRKAFRDSVAFASDAAGFSAIYKEAARSDPGTSFARFTASGSNWSSVPVRFLLVLSSIAVLFVSAPALAQTATWTIDPGHSAAQFTVRHMIVANVRGEFAGPTGTVTFDPADLKTLKVEASFDTKTINTRNADRDKDLRSDLFFDVGKYPKMTFKSKRAEPSAPGRLKLVGDLTIKGVTKEVTLDVEGPSPEIKDIWGERRIGATATTTIDRREFGLLYNRVLEGGGAVVGDTVNITIDVEFTRKGA
jgi:polyisoprenoid-binding protein YceI